MKNDNIDDKLIWTDTLISYEVLTPDGLDSLGTCYVCPGFIFKEGDRFSTPCGDWCEVIRFDKKRHTVNVKYVGDKLQAEEDVYEDSPVCGTFPKEIFEKKYRRVFLVRSSDWNDCRLSMVFSDEKAADEFASQLKTDTGEGKPDDVSINMQEGEVIYGDINGERIIIGNTVYPIDRRTKKQLIAERGLAKLTDEEIGALGIDCKYIIK